MTMMKFADILKLNRMLGEQLTQSPEYRIAVISNITIHQIKEVLELTLRERGLNGHVTIGDYDSIVQDSLKFSDYNAVLVFWEVCNLIDGLENKSYCMLPADIADLAARVEGEIVLILRNLGKTPIVLLNKFSSQAFSSNVLRKASLTDLCNRLNEKLSDELLPNQIIVDLDTVLARVGLDQAIDFRQYYSSRALYSIRFFCSYAEAVRPVFMAVTGRTKKVLVMDCDNTLWGGIIGEDGFAGIELSGDTTKGKIFRDVQAIVKGFRSEGVLLS